MPYPLSGAAGERSHTCMLKKLKKILPVILVAALALSVLAGCSNYTSKKLDGYSSDGEVFSNGGFVAQKGDYVYFINGAEDYTADNDYGDVVKGSLMRIHVSDLAAGNYTETDIVVSQLIVAQDYTSGIYIYGDRVYYATPNVIDNMEGEVESSYLDFKSSTLDGSKTMRGYYAQVSDNSTVYRYVEIDGVVYLVYVDATETEIHSYNTETKEDTILATDYTSYIFSDNVEDPTIYYTMSVTQPKTYDSESETGTTYEYDQLYAVRADATECPYTGTDEDGDEVPFYESEAFLDDYTDNDAEDDADEPSLVYINLGTLVLDGVGQSQASATLFNHDWTETENSATAISGYSYTFIDYDSDTNSLYMAVAKVTEGTSFVYRFDTSEYAAQSDWNSISENPSILYVDSVSATTSTDVITPVAISSDNATSSALYYIEDDHINYLYVSSGNIIRNTVDPTIDEASTSVNTIYKYTDLIGDSVTIARQQSSAVLMYIDGDYVYYNMAQTNGNGLYRMVYNGTEDDYNILTGKAYDDQDYQPTQFLEVDYNSTWYDPEFLTIDGTDYLFFCHAGDYAASCIYVMECPEDNESLEEINDIWEDVNDAMIELAETFSTEANGAWYYFYTGDEDLITHLTEEVDEDGDEGLYYENYTEENLAIIEAFMDPTTNAAQQTVSKYRLTYFSDLYVENDDGTYTFYNVETAFYSRLGYLDEDSEEDFLDALASAFLIASEEDDSWTWEWAALFVPIGVVVIGGGITAYILIRRHLKKKNQGA